MHQKPLGGMYTIISNLTAEEEKVASHPCGICCKNFSSASVRTNYYDVLYFKYIHFTGTQESQKGMQGQIPIFVYILHRKISRQERVHTTFE